MKEFSIMTIKKDSILYSVYDKDELSKTSYFYDNQIIYCNFHPIESNLICERSCPFFVNHVRYIQLQRDINLLFLLKEIRGTILFFQEPLCCKSYTDLIQLCKDKNVDGWFAPVRIRYGISYHCDVELGLLNDPNLFSIIKEDIFKHDARGYKNIEDDRKIKNWGVLYPLSFIERPIVMNLNHCYKEEIEKYVFHEKESKHMNKYMFQYLLKNAVITYDDE